MIPSVITDTSITFIARGRPWTLAGDHAHFGKVKELLQSGSDDADRAIQLTDVRIAVEAATDGAAVLTEEGLYLNGDKLSQAWESKAHSEPEAMRVLLVSPGDRVRVEGDEDAPDGVYVVEEVDNDDANKRVMVTSDEDYFGFVANASIKEIVEKAPPPDPSEEPDDWTAMEQLECENCSDLLEVGQSGLCDDCQEDEENHDE